MGQAADGLLEDIFNLGINNFFEMQEPGNLGHFTTSLDLMVRAVIDTFVDNNLPRDPTTWGNYFAGLSAFAGLNNLGHFAQVGPFDPETPLVEPAPEELVLETLPDQPPPDYVRSLTSSQRRIAPPENPDNRQMWNDMLIPPKQQSTAPRPAPRPMLDRGQARQAIREQVGYATQFSEQLGALKEKRQRRQQLKKQRALENRIRELQNRPTTAPDLNPDDTYKRAWPVETASETTPKPKKKQGKWEKLAREGISSSISAAGQHMMGATVREAGATVGGAIGGPAGAVAGAAIAQSGGMYYGKKLSDWMAGVERAQPTAEDLKKITEQTDREVDKLSEGLQQMAGPMTLVALSEMLANAAAGREWNLAHPPHMAVNDLRAMMTFEQRGFLNDVIASQPGFRGALTVPGDPRGSFYAYWARMILTDLPRAERLLRPLIATGDLARDTQGYQRATEMIIDFYNDMRPDLFQNVGRNAAIASSLWLSYQGAKKLWNYYKKWRPTKIRKPGEKKLRPPAPGPSGPPNPSPPPGFIPRPPRQPQTYRTKTARRKTKTKKKKKKEPTPMPAQRESERPKSPTKISKPKKSDGRSGERRKDSLLKLFKRLDKDKSGRLRQSELKGLARRFKVKARVLMNKMDTSGDGEVSWPEFARYMRRNLHL